MGLGVIVLLIGSYLVRKIDFLERFCIPAPVVGGTLFALLALILHQTGTMDIEMDITLRVVAMTAFFTTVGFSASFRLLKKGGIKVFIFLGLAVALVVLQNVLGIGLATLFDLNPLVGLATGSVPMTGGHGTAAAWGPELEKAGAMGAEAIAVAAATFGLIAGSMMGGPLGKRLIEKNNLLEKRKTSKKGEVVDIDEIDDSERKLVPNNFAVASYQILIAMAIGTIISKLIVDSTGLTFPPYIGAMLAAAIIRNISDMSHKFEVPMFEVDVIGSIALSLFLSMALMALKLWELADLAIPFIVMLVAQTVLMGLFAYFITFNVMGRDYDAAVLAGGHCGFGLGATPNGIANMTSITGRFGPSPVAFFILPLIGSLFIDFFNTGVITFFMNLVAK
jgi:ESS family glutamate:Na+ symporter